MPVYKMQERKLPVCARSRITHFKAVARRVTYSTNENGNNNNNNNNTFPDKIIKTTIVMITTQAMYV